MAGEPIPTFEELLLEFPLAHFNVDVKDEASAQQLAAIIERHEAHNRVLVASFLGGRRIAVQRHLSRPVATSPGVMGVAAAAMLGKLVRLPHRGLGAFAALQVPEIHGKFPVVTASLVRHAHEAGIQVHVWVVNDAPGMHRLLDLGVDGIMSDRADILAAVMRERGHWPQNTPGS